MDCSVPPRILRGPDPETDGLSAWTLSELCRVIEERFQQTPASGQSVAREGRMGFSRQKARQRHPRGSDPAAQEAFKKGSLVDAVNAAREAHFRTSASRLWFEDKARVGQKGTRLPSLVDAWAAARPDWCDQRYTWVHVFAAVRPATGERLAPW